MEADPQALVIALDAGARAKLLPLCTLPELRADHVTLAYGVPIAELDPAWIPGGARVGQIISLHAFAILRSSRVEALAIEIAGVRTRPFDGGPLHLTLCRSADARSHESNALVARGGGTPCDLWIPGVVEWRPVRREP